MTYLYKTREIDLPPYHILLVKYYGWRTTQNDTYIDGEIYVPLMRKRRRLRLRSAYTYTSERYTFVPIYIVPTYKTSSYLLVCIY